LRVRFSRLALLSAAVIGVLAGVIGCDTGNGTSTLLAPGLPTTAPPGNAVLYTSLSKDDRVVGYRLGTDGLLPAEPFTSMNIFEPRVIILGDGILYVLEIDRVVALTLAADGTLPNGPSSQSAPIDGAEGVDMVLNGDIL
jgi:hypothetical protein